MKYLPILLFGVVTLGIVSCTSTPANEPQPSSTISEKKSILWTALTPASAVYDDPTTTSECNPTDLKILRSLAQLNGISADFASDNPKEWNYKSLGVLWRRTQGANGQTEYRIISLGGERGQGETIQQLRLSSETETLTELERIELSSPQLAVLELKHLPKLRSVQISGISTSTPKSKAPIEHISLEQLPALDSLDLNNLPRLRKSNTDDALNLNHYYNLPRLRVVSLQHLGVTNLLIDLIQPLENLELSDNKALVQLNVSGATMNRLSFTPADYPNLETLKLNKVTSAQEQPIDLSSLSKLQMVIINAPTKVSNVSISSCPLLSDLTVSKANLRNISLESLPKLQSIDLSHNELSSINLVPFTALRTAHLGYNALTTSSSLRLPTSVHTLSLQGNEQLESLDLSGYQQLELVNLNGHQRSTESFGNQSNTLASLNIQGLSKLYRLLTSNNSLTRIITSSAGSYPEMELVEVKRNRFDFIGLWTLHQSFPNLSLNQDSEFAYGEQRPFPIQIGTSRELDLGELSGGQQEVKIRLISSQMSELTPAENYYTIDQASNKLRILESGDYRLLIDCHSIFPLLTQGLRSEVFTAK